MNNAVYYTTMFVLLTVIIIMTLVTHTTKCDKYYDAYKKYVTKNGLSKEEFCKYEH